VDDVGKGLTRPMKAYNSSIASLEGRVLPRARKFEDLGPAAGKQIDALSPLAVDVRPVVAAELTEAPELPWDSTDI